MPLTSVNTNYPHQQNPPEKSFSPVSRTRCEEKAFCLLRSSHPSNKTLGSSLCGGGGGTRYILLLNEIKLIMLQSLIKLLLAVVKCLASSQVFLHVFLLGSTHFPLSIEVIRTIWICTDSGRFQDILGHWTHSFQFNQLTQQYSKGITTTLLPDHCQSALLQGSLY